MGVLISVFTVLFVILSILLVVLILLQSDKSSGMGILGGSSSSAFGSSTADVMTKITGYMVAFFMLGALGLSVMESNRSSSLDKKLLGDSSVSATVIDSKVNKEDKKKEEKTENKKTR